MSSFLLTDDLQTALEQAASEARGRHNLFVDIEHLFLALLQNQDEPLKTLLENEDRAALAERVRDELGQVRDDPLENLRGLSRELESLLADASQQAQKLNHNAVNGGHVWLAMFNVGSEPIKGAMAALSFGEIQARAHVRNHSPKQGRAAREIPLQRVEHKPKPAARSSRPNANNAPRSIGFGQYLLVAVLAALGFMIFFRQELLISFAFVVFTWVFSLTLHEFAHAIVAYWGGDHTVKEKGYLTFNPLRYTHPLLSIGIPLLFLAMGGIGLPGGAVYIEDHRLRSRQWSTAVSLAGPLMNFMCAIVLAAPFFLGIIEAPPFGGPFRLIDAGRFESALAFSVFLQVTAVILNLLPIPPLDGFNALSPYMPPRLVHTARSFGLLTLFLIFYAFRVPAFGDAFFESVQQITDFLGVPWNLAVYGYDYFQFWR